MRTVAIFTLAGAVVLSGCFFSGCLILAEDDKDNSKCTNGIWNGDFDNNYHSLDKLHGCTEITGDLNLFSIDANVDVDASEMDSLNSLETVGGGVSLSSIDALIYLDALNNLEFIGADLSIGWCTPVSNLMGMGKLRHIGGDLKITHNDYMVSLEGLDALDTLGGDLTVTDNPELPDCEIGNLISFLLSIGWNGNAIVNNNDSDGTCDG